MNFVDIILTTDKRFYIGHPWEVKPGDMVGVTNQCGEKVVKAVEAVMTKNCGGEELSFLVQFAGRELKRIDAVYHKEDVIWLEEKEEQNVSE